MALCILKWWKERESGRSIVLGSRNEYKMNINKEKDCLSLRKRLLIAVLLLITYGIFSYDHISFYFPFDFYYLLSEEMITVKILPVFQRKRNEPLARLLKMCIRCSVLDTVDMNCNVIGTLALFDSMRMVARKR